MVDEDEVLTVEEVGRRLKISLDLARRLFREGKLPGTKVGREWRVRKVDLDEYLRGGRRPQEVGNGKRESSRVA